MSVDVTLVTYSGLPELDPDDRPLAEALAAAGLRVTVAAWDRPDIDWAASRLVLLRNPWDYHLRLDEFLAWAERVASVTRLLNPLPALRWNLHKGYLAELAARDAPVVPTLLLRQGERCDLATEVTARGWSDLVVKPAVSADSWETHRFAASEVAVAQREIDRLLAERDLLVQPFLTTVEGYGERCLVFLDGAFSHAVRKNALTQGGRWVGLPEGTPVAATPTELDAAARVLVATPYDDLLYARVDLVANDAGRPLLLELELAEPTLFLRDSPEGLARLVDAIGRRLAPEGPADGVAPSGRPC